MKCKSCDKTIPENSKYCEHCGNEVSKQQEFDSVFNKAVEHLEFIGYVKKHITSEDKWITCLFVHPTRSNIVVRYIHTIGFSFSARYSINKDACRNNRKDLLEIINAQNAKSTLTCFSVIDNEEIGCFGWYPPEYSKMSFSSFIEQLESDIARLLQNEQMKPYYTS